MATIKFPFDHFHMNSVEEFRAKALGAGYQIPLSSDLRVLCDPFSVNGRKFENTMAVQPLEGLDAWENGAPSPLTHARYEKLAAQGAGILWVEATAIVPEGRDSLRQLWLHRENVPEFRKLAQTIDSAALKAGYRPPYKVIQLTHSGRCSVDGSGKPKPQAAFASPYLDPVMGEPEIVTDEYLDQLQLRFGEAAALAWQAGFDAVELKLCHQYLFKELLCAYTRPGRYGGSLENRFRFALGAVDKVRARLGSRIDIVVRLNAYDGIPWPYGWGMVQPDAVGAFPAPAGALFPETGAFSATMGAPEAGRPLHGPMAVDLSEVKELMRQLYRKDIRIFNLTTTSPRFAPTGNGYLDNFDSEAQVDPFAGVSALLKATKEIRSVMPADLKIVGTGLSWPGPFSANAGAGGIARGWFDIAGFGRSVMADDGFIPAILEGRQPGKDGFCMGCDRCFELFFADLPTGCAMYKAAYRDLHRKLQEERPESAAASYVL